MHLWRTSTSQVVLILCDCSKVWDCLAGTENKDNMKSSICLPHLGAMHRTHWHSDWEIQGHAPANCFVSFLSTGPDKSLTSQLQHVGPYKLLTPMHASVPLTALITTLPTYFCNTTNVLFIVNNSTGWPVIRGYVKREDRHGLLVCCILHRQTDRISCMNGVMGLSDTMQYWTALWNSLLLMAWAAPQWFLTASSSGRNLGLAVQPCLTVVRCDSHDRFFSL